MTALTRNEPGTFSCLTTEDRELAWGHAKFLDVLSALRELAWGAGVLLHTREELRAECKVGIHKLKEALAFWEAHGRLRRLGLRGSPLRGAIEVLPPPKDCRDAAGPRRPPRAPSQGAWRPPRAPSQGARRPPSAPRALFTLGEQREEERDVASTSGETPPAGVCEDDATRRDASLETSPGPGDGKAPDTEPKAPPPPDREDRIAEAERVLAEVRNEHGVAPEVEPGGRMNLLPAPPPGRKPEEFPYPPPPEAIRAVAAFAPEVREILRRRAVAEARARLPPAERPEVRRAVESLRGRAQSRSPTALGPLIDEVMRALGDSGAWTRGFLERAFPDVQGLLSWDEVADLLVRCFAGRTPPRWFTNRLGRRLAESRAARKKAAAGAT